FLCNKKDTGELRLVVSMVRSEQYCLTTVIELFERPSGRNETLDRLFFRDMLRSLARTAHGLTLGFFFFQLLPFPLEIAAERLSSDSEVAVIIPPALPLIGRQIRSSPSFVVDDVVFMRHVCEVAFERIHIQFEPEFERRSLEIAHIALTYLSRDDSVERPCFLGGRHDVLLVGSGKFLNKQQTKCYYTPF